MHLSSWILIWNWPVVGCWSSFKNHWSSVNYFPTHLTFSTLFSHTLLIFNLLTPEKSLVVPYILFFFLQTWKKSELDPRVMRWVRIWSLFGLSTSQFFVNCKHYLKIWLYRKEDVKWTRGVPSLIVYPSQTNISQKTQPLKAVFERTGYWVFDGVLQTPCTWSLYAKQRDKDRSKQFSFLECKIVPYNTKHNLNLHNIAENSWKTGYLTRYCKLLVIALEISSWE